MLSNFSHYSPQGFIPQFPGLQGAGWPQMSPGLFGQPGTYAGYVPFAQEPALTGMYPSPFLQTPFAPSPFLQTPFAPSPFLQTPFAPSPFLQTPFASSPFAPSPFLQTPFAPSPFAPSPFAPSPFAPTPFAPSPFLQTPFASSPFAPNPLIGSFAGYAGAHHPAQQIVLLLGQLAQQISAQTAVTQQISIGLQQLVQQLAVQGLQNPGALGAFGGQYFAQSPFSGATQGAFGGFTPQAQPWGANRAQTIQ